MQGVYGHPGFPTAPALNRSNRWYGAQSPVALELKDQNGRIEWDCNRGQVAKVVLLGTGRTLVPINFVEGGWYQLWVFEDSTGSRTITTYTNVDFGTPGAPTLTTTANRCDVLDFVAIAVGATPVLKLRCTGQTKGFS